MGIKTKQDVALVTKAIEDLIFNYLDSKFTLGVERLLGVEEEVGIKRCGSCPGFAEYIDENERTVAHPHSKGCDVAALEEEILHQLNEQANPGDLAGVAHNTSELMLLVPSATATWSRLSSIRRDYAGHGKEK